ncbi:MAG: TIGR02206 family membrane protein [Candidatus Acidiferrales bacterium]
MNPPLDITPGAWTVFAPYGWLHGVTLLVCLVLIVAPSLLGRTLSKNAERALRYSLAAFAVAVWLAYNIWWNWRGIDWQSGLPLQLCDINGLMAPFALVTGKRFARATLYFWTAALTAQAFIQPSLIDGPAFVLFWAFWISHTVIAACAVYDVVVRGFRPLLARSRHRGDRKPRLCGADPADRSSSRRRLRLRRQPAGGHRHPAIRPGARPLATAGDCSGGAGADWIRHRAAAVGDCEVACATGRRGAAGLDA